MSLPRIPDADYAVSKEQSRIARVQKAVEGQNNYYERTKG